jgi:hypothetical protein
LAHLGLGELARHRGELDEALRWCQQALGECGSDWQGATARSHVLTALGRIAEVKGAVEQARSLHREAVEIALGQQFRTHLVDAMLGCAGLVLLEGNAQRAAQLLGMAEALRGTAIAGDPDVDRLRERVGTDPEYHRGRAMTFDDVVEFLSSP